MAIIYRRVKGSSLTNDEVDDNFEYLWNLVDKANTDISNVEGQVLADLSDTFNAALALKQPLNSKLTAISSGISDGFVFVSGDSVISRNLSAGDGIVLTFNTGGNDVIRVSDSVATTSTQQVLSNKTISGLNNTITNVSLSAGVSGTLPITNGGTGAITAATARDNLNVLARPSTDGLAVRVGQSTEARTVRVSGSGLSIVNGSGILGDPTITSNATASNTANTIVYRDSTGNFEANTIKATLVGNITGNASTVTNGVYTTGSYADPVWLTSLAGSKVTGIPNSSLQNQSITINGTAVALGSSVNISIPTVTASTDLNTPDTLVKRNSSGNFSAGVVTANLVGNVTGNVSGTASNNVLKAGDTMTGPLILSRSPVSSMEAATKQYVDTSRMQITYGNLSLSNSQLSSAINPPAGLTISNLKGFLPALGSVSVSSIQQINAVNVIIAIDTSGSAQSYLAEIKTIANYIVSKYSTAGATFCLVDTINGDISKWTWTTAAGANNGFDKTQAWTYNNTLSSIFFNRPQPNAQTIAYFITDASHDLTSIYTQTLTSFRNFAVANRLISYGLTINVPGRLMTAVDKYCYDGVNSTTFSGAVIAASGDIPGYSAPAPVYSQADISWQIQGNQIVVSMPSTSEQRTVGVNWLAIWG